MSKPWFALVASTLETLHWAATREVVIKIVLLTIGGAAGTNARYWLGHWVALSSWGRPFPLGTFIINVTGSFIVGLINILLMERAQPHHRHTYLLLSIGFCGAYTTFSTFEYETLMLIRQGHWGLALTYVMGSVLAGFVAVAMGVSLAEQA